VGGGASVVESDATEITRLQWPARSAFLSAKFPIPFLKFGDGWDVAPSRRDACLVACAVEMPAW